MKENKSSPPKRVVKGVQRKPLKSSASTYGAVAGFSSGIVDKALEKPVWIVGGVFFLIECILAVIFYRERLVVDSSYYFFNTIQNGWFKIDHQRFILAFAEVLPLLGSYLGLPFKALLVLYSLNHVFFFLVLFLVLMKRKDWNGALAITALLAFNTPNLFVNPFLEIWYGAGFAVLLNSFLQKAKFDWKDYMWILLLEITILFSHPENYILVLFLFVLDIQKRKKFNCMHIIMLIVLLASARYKYVTVDDYEAAKFGGNFHGAKNHHLLDLLSGENMAHLCSYLFQYYWVLLIILVISCAKYILSRNYLRGAIVLLAFLGTVGLLSAIDKTYEYTVYGSTMYMPVLSIVLIPFFYDIFNSLKGPVKTIAFGSFVLLVGIRFYIQVDALTPYTERVNQMERMITDCDKAGGSKFILKSNDFVKPYTQVSWSLPIETLLLSAERGQDKCRSVIRYEDINEYSKRVLTDTSAFMFTYQDVRDDKILNQKYFHIESGVYKVLDFKE